MTWTAWCATDSEPATFRCREQRHDVRELPYERQRDPAVEAWRETLAEQRGESASARLQRVERELAEAIAERDEMVARKIRMQRDLETQLADAREQLVEATVAARKPCAYRDLAVQVMQELAYARAQLDDLIASRSSNYPARQDVGPCVECGQPIVRGHWVESVAGATKPQWRHAAGVCPDPNPSDREN